MTALAARRPPRRRPPRRRPPEPPPPDTRARVLTAAARLFVQRGYFSTSIKDLVRASGVSVGSIYHHFGGKQDVAEALYRETTERFLLRMQEREAAERSVEGRLQALTALIYQEGEEAPERLEFMLFVSHTEISPDALPACLSKPFQVVTAWIEEGMRRGEVEEGRAEVAAGAFMGAILKLVELRLRGRIGPPLPGLAAEAFRLAWRAIAARR